MWNHGILHKWIAPGDPLGRWPKVPPPAVASNVATPVVFDSLHGHQLPSLPRFLGKFDQISADDISWMMSILEAFVKLLRDVNRVCHLKVIWEPKIQSGTLLKLISRINHFWISAAQCWEVPQSWDTLRTHCIFHDPFDCLSLFVFWKVFPRCSLFHNIHHPNHHSTESMRQDPL